MTARFLTRQQAAAYSGVTTRTLDKWLGLGLSRIRTPTGCIRIDRLKLEEFLLKHEEAVSS